MANSPKDTKWFKEKVKAYYGDKVEVLSEYLGSEKPITILYHCEKHGDTEKIINAKNVCKDCFLPCKQCQKENKIKAQKKRIGKGKGYYYQRLKDYCNKMGGYVLEPEWTKAKDVYHFKCNNELHPIFETTADALYSGGHWCPYCSGRKGNFEKDIRDIISSKDGQLLTKYKSALENVRVKCNKHDYEWDISPANLKKGRWCPVCNMPFSEKVVFDYLKKSIDFNKHDIRVQYKFEDLASKNENLRFDFAIIDRLNNVLLLIEVDDVEHIHNHKTERRINARNRDHMKNDYCKEKDLELLRYNTPFRISNQITYSDYYSDIEKNIGKHLKEMKII